MAPTNVQTQDQNQGQAQGQEQGQTQANDLTNVIDASSVATLSNTAPQMNAQSMTMKAAPNVVMVPNNNTENCLRVIGLSFANTSGGGGLGIPYRSRKCDLEQSADDAFAQGNMQLGWFFKCQNKNIYKTFARSKSKSTEQIDACTQYAWKMLEPKQPINNETVIRVDVDGLIESKGDCRHDETHQRIFEICQEK